MLENILTLQVYCILMKRRISAIIALLLFYLFSELGITFVDKKQNETRNPVSRSTGPVTPAATVAGELAGKGETAIVARVIDGDTVELAGGTRLRYIGIDTPELSGQKECYGKESYEKNRELVEGKTVTLEKDVSEIDRYGRLLRYVWLDDRLVNEMLVSGGFANAVSYPPDIKYQEIFRAAEIRARESTSGLWGSICNP